MLKEKRVAGIIMGSHLINTHSYSTIHGPIITFDRYLGEDIPYIGSDNFTGGQIATQHLIDRGCKSLLHISGSHQLHTQANQRADGFKITCINSQVKYQIVEYQHAQLTFEYYYEYVQKEISPLLSTIDGVFCSNDLLAYALYVYCNEHEIRVPEDLKIIGYDYCLFARLLQFPKLTTVAQPIALIGERLCKNIIEMIEEREESKVYSQTLGVKLIKGTTT